MSVQKNIQLYIVHFLYISIFGWRFV